jgi:serine/threonine protein kinase/tetratricopeptide (TPR) repeat protein
MASRRGSAWRHIPTSLDQNQSANPTEITGPDPERWAAILAAFDEVAALDEEARQSRLDAMENSDPPMRREIERLLASDSCASRVLSPFDALLGEAPASDPLKLVGQTVSHFRVLECIGKGGMGVVYRAEDVQLGRMVALKVPTGAADQVAIERFRREARVAAGLEHPNLCPVFETGETPNGDLFYVMPFYEGETLKQALGRRERIPIPEALEIATQIGRGLAALHQTGIVHRDLKPANVMLLEKGGVRILDFGLAKGNDATLTATWALMGTIGYMAPEQVNGVKVDPRTDLWALGIVLYEMVTGTRPFVGNEMGTVHSILHNKPPLASSICKELPPGLDDLIQRCLRKDPAERYQSADDLVTTLGGIRLDERPSPLRKVRLAQASLRRRLVRPGSVLIAGAVLTALGALVLWRGGSPSKPDQPVTVQSLAILPLTRNPTHPADEYLEAGFSDELASLLSRTRAVRVAERTSVTSLRQKGVDPRAIGVQLGVQHILQGSFDKQSDTLHVDLELSRVADGGILWMQRFRVPASDLMGLEREVAAGLLRVLHPKGPLVADPRTGTNDPIAYELYLKGRFAWRKRTPESLEQALADFRGALERDPRFAKAHAGMAETYWVKAGTDISAREAYANADVASAKALTLDSTLAAAHATRGIVLANLGRYSEAEVSLRRSIGINPDYSLAHQFYSLLLTMLGRLPESWEQNEAALSLDPLGPGINTHRGILLAVKGDLGKAREQLGLALSLSPNSPMALLHHGAFGAAQGNYEEARRDLQKLVEREAGFGSARGALAFVYDRLGRPAESRRLLAEARAAVKDERTAVNYALALAVMGQFDSAFARLRTAKDGLDVTTLVDLRVSPLLRDFRADPRYGALLSDIGLRP